MREIERLTEHDMIAAFICAELHSERFGERVRAALCRHHAPLHVAEHPDTANPEQNAQRLAVLRDYRHYRQGRSLFSGFPFDDVTWSRVSLARDEVLAIRYIDYSYWIELSGGTRLPTDAAHRIRAGTADPARAQNFLRIADALDRGTTFHEMIAVTAGPEAPLVVLEGHLRLTVYALRPDRIPEPLTLVLGSSPRIGEWGCY